MTPAEKQAVLTRITGARLGVRSPWTVYSFSSWIQTHKLASVVAAILIVAVSGNSVVLAAQGALPGDALYALKVQVAEPIRIALVVDPVKKAEIHTSFVQSRFEEAETLAARGDLDESKVTELTVLLDRHVADVAKNIEEMDEMSPEKAEDTNIAVEASMNAHARVLSTIGINKRAENVSSNISRIVDKARTEAQRFDVSNKARGVMLAVHAVEDAAAQTLMSMSAAPAPDTEDISVSANRGDDNVIVAAKIDTASSIELESPVVTEKSDTRSAKISTSARKTEVASSSRESIETKRQKKEAEIYEKAKQRLEKEIRSEELKRPSNDTKDREEKAKNSRDIRRDDSGRDRMRFDRDE
ncbi:MAG: DUF5667 domain-containing protein [Patescibacteria group bacterium]